MRPHIIHANRGGVTEEHLPPSFFTSERRSSGAVARSARVEILRHAGLSDDQRQTIVGFCRDQLGKGFADLGWRYDVATYAFGLPSRRLGRSEFSCHGLAYQAHAQAGVSFPHQLRHSPVFNVARYLGHPLGHPADQIDVDRLYARDHHLYWDNRFAVVLAAFDSVETAELQTVVNPGKYSWSPSLRELYAARASVIMSSVQADVRS